MRHLQLFFLVFLFTFYSSGVSAKKCPELNFRLCPKKAICKRPLKLEGKKLEQLMNELKRTQFDLPWSVKTASDFTIESKTFESMSKLDELFKKAMKNIKKEMEKYDITKKVSKSFTEASFKISEKMALDSWHGSKNAKKVMKEIKGVKKIRVRLSYRKSKGKKGTTKFYLYHLKKKSPKPRPVLIIMPPVYGISPFDIGMAIEYASFGFQVAVLELGGVKFVSPFNEISKLKESMAGVIGDTHRMIQYLKKHREIDKDNIGIFGFSLGGLLSSMVYVVNDEIKVLASAMGGANFPELFTNSEQAMAKLYRSYRMDKENLRTRMDYFKALERALPYEPMSLAHRRKESHAYFVASFGDTLVPSKNQWDLTQAFDASCEKGNVRWEKDQHLIAIVKDLLKRDQLRTFLINKLMK